VIAALLPLIFPFVSMITLAVVSDGSFLHTIEEGGVWSFVVMALAAFAGLVCAVLLFLAGRGMRVPAAIGIFVAALPWLGGLAGMRLGISMAASAVAYADAASRATMMAKGISEASSARLFGTTLSASLLGAMAVGWAIASLGQRAPNRKALLALPFGVLGAIGMVAMVVLMFQNAGGGVLLILLSGLGAMLALALGGWGAGGDVPHGRGAALAAAAGLAAWFGSIAAAYAIETSGIRNAFGAVAMADAASKATMLAMGASEMAAATRGAMFGGVVLALAAVGLAIYGATRARPSAGRIAGGVAAVLVVALVWALDGVAARGAGTALEEVSQPPWAGISGFQPAPVVGVGADPGDMAPLQAVVATDRVTILRGGTVVPLSAGVDPASRAPLVQAFRAFLPAAGATPAAPSDEVDADRRRMIEEMLRPRNEWGGDGGDRPPYLVLAIDGRVPGPALRNLIEAAREAGARAIRIDGEPPVSPERRAMFEELRDDAPIMAALLRSVTSTQVDLAGATLDAELASDPVVYFATIDAAPRVEVRTRPGAPAAPFTVDTTSELASRGYWDRPAVDGPPARVYLAIGDGATVAQVLAVTERLAAENRIPVLLGGPLPQATREPAAPPAGVLGVLGGGGFGEGLIGLGDLGTIGGGGLGDPPAGGAVNVRAGDANVRGSLSRDVIQRVIRRHLNEVRYCYERGLAGDPSLQGRVTVSFIISPSGNVQSASVADSTLSNPGIESCITNAVNRWTFPRPEGGIVMVNYPFVLQSSP
jgi:TonB family protein